MMATASKANRNGRAKDWCLGPQLAGVRASAAYQRTAEVVRAAQDLTYLLDAMLEDFPPDSGSPLERLLGGAAYIELFNEWSMMRKGLYERQWSIAKAIPYPE